MGVLSARKHLTQTLFREAERLGSSLEHAAADLETLVYHTDTVDLSSGAVETAVAIAQVNARDIDQLFRRAKRCLGDAAAKWYWDALCDSGVDPDTSKLRAVALAADTSVAPALESAAKILVDTWRKEHNAAIGDLPDAKRAQFYNIWQQSKAPEQVALILPSQITAAGSDKTEKKHLFANRGVYPVHLTGWEADVLKSEIAKKTLVGWYRNPTGGSAAVAVPYTQSQIARTMYPDFLFFHKVDGETVVDLVDPHRPSEADTGPKWAGLAEYASKHSELFRRVIAVIKNADGVLVSIDLKNPSVAAAMQEATTETDIRKAFEEFGGNY